MLLQERPLLIKPPDHSSLSPEERVVEERFRLCLYRDIADRIHAAMVQLEASVRARRRSQGLGAIDDVSK